MATPTPAGLDEIWPMEQLPDCVEVLLDCLVTLTIQVKRMEKKIQVVSHALSNKDNAGSSETRLFEIEELPDSLEDLQVLLGSLSDQVKEVEEMQKVILHAFPYKDNAAGVVSKKKPTVEDIIIVFVEEIEKTHQYFEFQHYLKREHPVKSHHDAFEVLRCLVQDLQVHEYPQFNKLDFKQIFDAVEGNTRYEYFLEEENDWYSLMSSKEEDVSRLMNPILSLVYYIREKGHVMDENPLVELSYIFNFDNLFYKICFVWRLLRKFSEKEVLVRFVPLDFEEDDVEAELSICGKIESFRFDSLGSGGGTKTAYVTFENSVAAKIAPLFMIRKSHLFIEPAREEYKYQPKEMREYDKAMARYKELRKYSKKMSN